VQGKGDSSLSINFNQHKLIDEVVSEVCKVGDIGCYFCIISNSCQMFSPQTVGFEEDSSLFEPGKEVVILTLELILLRLQLLRILQLIQSFD